MSNRITHSAMFLSMIAAAQLRAQTGDDFLVHVEAAFELVREMLEFISIKKPEMNASEMILVGEIMTAQMVANYWPDMKKAFDKKTPKNKDNLMHFMSTMQNIVNTMIEHYFKEEMPPVFRKEAPLEKAVYSQKECYEGIVRRVHEIHQLLAYCTGK